MKRDRSPRGVVLAAFAGLMLGILGTLACQPAHPRPHSRPQPSHRYPFGG